MEKAKDDDFLGITLLNMHMLCFCLTDLVSLRILGIRVHAVEFEACCTIVFLQAVLPGKCKET